MWELRALPVPSTDDLLLVQEGARRVIPKIIHRIWLDDPMPATFEEFGRRWEYLHPEWELRDWRSSAELPEDLPGVGWRMRARELCPNDWKRFIADVLRLELLASFGGLYVDTDVEPHQNITPLLEGESCVVGFSPQHINGEHPITNCFMAAEPGHTYLVDLLLNIGPAIGRFGHRSLATMIGPWHLTRTLRNDPERRYDVTVLPWQELFEGPWITHHWNTAKRKAGEGLG